MEAIKYIAARMKRYKGPGEIIVSSQRDKVEKAIAHCRSSLHASFRSADDVKMSTLIARLGRAACGVFELELEFADTVQVGKVFFEAFMNGEELVRIERQFERTPKRNGEWVDNPYIVYPTERLWSSIKKITPVHTSLDPIPDISGLMNSNGVPLIKRWGRGDQDKFMEFFSDAPFVKAANVLQQTGWRVNEKVYKIIKEDHLDKFIPEKLPSLKKGSKDQRREAQRQHSKALSSAAIVNKAQRLLSDTFYQYVDFDFRGRVYYREHFFNFQGTDLARGLMKFDEAKPLGEDGLYWLAVHTANSYNCSFGIDEIPEYFEHDYKSHLEREGLTDISLDKLELDDRVRWVNENMERILFTGLFGGLPDCEKPVSYLAACLEWVEIDKMDDPTWYFCSLPIGVDGSNNGWQHLGAMLKDDKTGSLVGLVPQEIPNDLYVKVARELVNSYPAYFEERGMPMKAIRKGIAKRGTMTKAYSAGRATMAENMWNDIYQYGYDQRYGVTEEDCEWLAAALIESINSVCPKPMEAMKALQNMASELVTGKGDMVQWLTPSGFPVDQRYMHSNDWKLHLNFNPPGIMKGFKGRIYTVFKQHTDNPDYKQHQNSISPNFVHSQDASHLALTVANWDGPFGAVHDSFSVHASDVDDLLDLTKSVFVEMYDEDNFLGTLAEDLGAEVDLPELGDLDISEVIYSDYFFA